MSLASSLPDVDLLRQIADRSLSAFFVFNLSSRRFDYLNEAFTDIWAIDGEAINQQLLPLIASIHEQDRDHVGQSYERLLTRSFRQTAEFRIRLKNRKQKWIGATAYAILHKDERQFIAGFAEDISHFKENEILADKYSVEKNGVLEMLAHDLGGPLGIVHQLAKLLEQKARQQGQPAFEEYGRHIAESVGNSMQLIHELLEKEFLDSSQAAFKFQRIELVEQIHAMLSGFERMDQNDHKHFIVESSHPQIEVQVDQTKFMQVLVNLVSNANKFTPPNGHITIHVQEQIQRVLISVSDDGIGIPEQLLPHIFERFTPARREGLKGEKTVGLGLSIVKRIVELHQGKIWVESKENQGTTFFIEIPKE
jgi:two-component system sensor histidine kinase VicK